MKLPNRHVFPGSLIGIGDETETVLDATLGIRDMPTKGREFNLWWHDEASLLKSSPVVGMTSSSRRQESFFLASSAALLRQIFAVGERPVRW